MSYRNDLEALTARQTALEVELKQRERELAETRRLVDEFQARARLPVLDNLGVAAPCTVSWDGMTGDDRVRSCAQCHKNVYNLSDLTREQAEALIREREGSLCVRYYQRADGTILLKDCEVGVKRRKRRRVIAAGVAASLAGAAVGFTRPTHHHCERPPAPIHAFGPEEPHVVMGQMIDRSAPPPTTHEAVPSVAPAPGAPTPAYKPLRDRGPR